MEEADIHMDAEIWGTPPDQVQLPLIRRNSLLFHQSKDDWMAHLNEYVLLVLIPVDLDRFPDRDAALIRCRLIFFVGCCACYYSNQREFIPIGFRIMCDSIFPLIFVISHFYPKGSCRLGYHWSKWTASNQLLLTQLRLIQRRVIDIVPPDDTELLSIEFFFISSAPV